MTPRGKRALIGCGIGCGAVLLIVIASAIAFTIWIRQPATPLEPARLLADDTIGYLEWKLRREDPETEAFLRAVIEKTGEIPAQAGAPLPEWVLDGIRGYQVRRNEAALDKILPVVAAWTLRHRADTGRFEQVFLLNLQSVGNRMRFADWVMGFTFGGDEGPAIIEEHGDETIYRIKSDSGSDLSFFIREGSVYFTTDPGSARGLVDRLVSAESGGRGTEALARLLAGIPAEKPLRAAVVNDEEAIRRIVGRISAKPSPPDLSWDRLESATLRGGFTEDRGFAARLDFSYADGPPPEGSGEALATMVSSVLGRWNLSVESTVTVEGRQVGLDLVFPDLLDRARLVPETAPSP